MAKHCGSMFSFFMEKCKGVKNISNSVFFACLCRSIIPYLKKFGKHPVSGAPLKQEDLIPLTFHKNSDGELNLGYESTNVAHIC